jgi:hypothetical protein
MVRLEKVLCCAEGCRGVQGVWKYAKEWSEEC